MSEIGYYGQPVKHLLRNGGWHSNDNTEVRRKALHHILKTESVGSVIAALEDTLRKWEGSEKNYNLDACRDDIEWLRSEYPTPVQAIPQNQFKPVQNNIFVKKEEKLKFNQSTEKEEFGYILEYHRGMDGISRGFIVGKKGTLLEVIFNNVGIVLAKEVYIGDGERKEVKEIVRLVEENELSQIAKTTLSKNIHWFKSR